MSEINQTPAPEKHDREKKNFLPWIITILFFIGILVIGWLYFNSRKEVELLLSDKEFMKNELQGELDSLMGEHEKIKFEYGSLSDSLTSKDSVIQVNAVEIKKLLNTQWEYYKVKKKLEKLREIAQGYVIQMDSLYTVNAELKEENLAIKKDFEKEQRKNIELQQDKENLTDKINDAAYLKAYDISASGIRFKSASDERVTDRLRKTDKIKVCFTISENKLIEQGVKNIYVRIARPDNLIITKGEGDEYSFKYKGETLQYTMMKEIDYNRQDVDECLYWINNQNKDDLIAGQYVVTIFWDDNEIGQTFFNLK